MAFQKMRRSTSIARFYRNYRAFMGYSQSDLAKLLKVHPQYISNIERGVNLRPYSLSRKLIPLLTRKDQNHLLDLLKESLGERIFGG